MRPVSHRKFVQWGSGFVKGFLPWKVSISALEMNLYEFSSFRPLSCAVVKHSSCFCVCSEVFPDGLPEEFTLIFTLTLKKAALRDTTYLLQISDEQGYPQVFFSFLEYNLCSHRSLGSPTSKFCCPSILLQMSVLSFFQASFPFQHHHFWYSYLCSKYYACKLPIALSLSKTLTILPGFIPGALTHPITSLNRLSRPLCCADPI